VDGAFLLIAVLMTPVAAISLSRATVIGVQPVMYLHAVFAVLFLVAAVLRRRLSLNVKIAALLLSCLILGATGLAAFGLVGLGPYALVMVVLMATAFMGKRMGWLALGTVAVIMAGVGFGISSGAISFDFDIQAYVLSPATWFLNLFTMVVFTGLILILFGKIHDSLAESIVSLERKAAELAETRDEAEAASRTKSAFLANISHEFRTPLNAIAGFTEILGRSLTDPAQQRQIAEIQASGASLKNLLNGILDFTRSESEQMVLKQAPLDIVDFFGGLRGRYQQRAGSKDLDFRIDLDPGMPSAIFIDPIRFQQILDSLVDNAFKFTAQGHIAVQARSVPGRESDTVDLKIDVEDTGIGIPEDQHTHIFKAMTQAQDQSINEYGGTGMGLALTQRIVDAMKGTISLTSQVDVGSTFRVALSGVTILDEEPIGRTVVEDISAEEIADTADGNAEWSVEDLSPETRARLPELEQILAQEQDSCEGLADTLTINEVEDFADRMRQTAESFEYPPLLLWSERLLTQTADFDMDGIAQTLGSFDTLVEETRSQL